MNSTRTRLIAVPIAVAALAGFLGAGVYGALAFGGPSAPAQEPTRLVQQAANDKAAAVKAAKPVAHKAVKHAKAKVATKKATTTTHAKALTVTKQDAPADPQSPDTTAAPDPENGGGGGGEGGGGNTNQVPPVVP